MMPAPNVSTFVFAGELFKNWIAINLASVMRDAFHGLRSPSYVRMLNFVSSEPGQARSLGGEWPVIKAASPWLFGAGTAQDAVSRTVHSTSIANAEQLPFRDQSYDVVMNLFGAMYATQPDAIQSELLRVCRTGGRLLMANWTPGSVFGQTLRLVSQLSPPAERSKIAQAVLWGDECAMIAQLRGRASGFCFKTRSVTMRFSGAPEDVVAMLCKTYSPLARLLVTLKQHDQTQLNEKLATIWARRNVAGVGVTETKANYLTVTATRL